MNTNWILSGAAPFVIAAALAWSAPALAQDKDDTEIEGRPDNYITLIERRREDIVVSAHREADLLYPENYNGSVTVLTETELEQRQIRNIEDALRDVPSVAVSSVAGQTQIRLRGTEANHVLVLVDGIEVSDPGSGEYDIGTLQAEIGSRLEVLRGPQSALYGNDAIAGVIGYESASGRNRKGFDVFLEGGTNNTINGSARYGAAGNGWDAALSATVVSTDGEPNARPIAGNGVRGIGRDSYTISGRGSVEVAPDFTLRAVGRYVLTEGQFNDQDFTFGSPTNGLVIDSFGNTFENEAISGLVGANLVTAGGAWTHDLSAQFTDADRQTTAPAGFPSSTLSDRFKASYISSYAFGDSGHSLTFAADYELEGFNNVSTFDDRNEVENGGFVVEYRYSDPNNDRFDVSAALRQDVNDLFQDPTTFRVGAGFKATDTTRLRAAVGTGIKNPTLNELFGFFDGAFVGNPNLEPEESTSWEIGFDQSFADGAVTVSATYFNAELENEIFSVFDFVTFVSSPDNRMTQSEQRGVELALSAYLGGGFTFKGAYSYTDAEEDGQEEIRRPDHLGSAVLNWSDPKGKASVNLAVRYTGEAIDTNFATFTNDPLEAYTLVNLNARFKVVDGLSVFGRVENLLDEQYEPVFSFVAPGINAVFGFEASF
ncbi:MAG: TonB-dependent receptor [Pseudomonadota bacterium]